MSLLSIFILGLGAITGNPEMPTPKPKPGPKPTPEPKGIAGKSSYQYLVFLPYSINSERIE